jgi:hypothetical protein
MYVRLEVPPAQPANYEEFQHEGQWYRTINAVEQLRQHTEVFLNEDIKLFVEYESLEGHKYELRQTEPAPFGWCFYRRVESLLEFDPRRVRQAPHKSRPTNAAPAPTGALDLFAKHFAPPPYEPKGVDHVTLETEVDLTGVREGEEVGQIVMADKFLNPSGTICVYAKLYGHRTGRWKTRISIDGEEIDVLTFDAFVPEVMQFPNTPPDQYAEIERLRAHFRAKRNRK